MRVTFWVTILICSALYFSYQLGRATERSQMEIELLNK